MMRQVKEVIVFAEQGDPKNLNTFSNVSYFLIENIQANGVKVHSVNLAPANFFHKVLEKIWMLLFKKRSSFYTYRRSKIYYLISRYKIKRSLKKFRNAEACIFITFSHSATGLTKKPSVLLCDWTIEHYFDYFLERKPDLLEIKAVERQNRIIEHADFIFVLFPGIAESMKKRFMNPHIYYIGNIVNNLFISVPENIKSKKEGNSLVFIGTRKYIKGATDLISAFNILKQTITDLTVDFIGIDADYFESLPEGIYCHGYLNKGVKEQADKYYSLLRKAKLFINTTPKWGAFSASVEAMYFYTPVLLTPYEEFVKTFGKEINFGSYFNAEHDNLVESINSLLKNTNYEQICYHAHDAVKEYTWEQYVRSMFSIITKDKGSSIAIDTSDVL